MAAGLLELAAAGPAQAATATALAGTPLESQPVAAPAGFAATSPFTAPPAAGPTAKAPAWVAVPRLTGRLHAADIGVVINTADPGSVTVGEHYIAVRHLTPAQVLRVELPVRHALTRAEFEGLKRAIDARFDRNIQALALAWTEPYAVECNGITAALALGFDAALCSNGCARSRPSRYFNSASSRPLDELGFRPSMLLAARTVAQALALVDRGAAADGALARRGRPPVTALFLTTADGPRRVRTPSYPPPGVLRALGVELRVAPAAALATTPHIFLAIIGSVRAPVDPPPDWAPGALADHLTSFGGDLLGTHGQGTALDWIESGAVASYGTVSEPCNHPQKFPHPQLLLGHYLQGSTALEAYWKSVAWPQQGVFIGDPLAAPFSPPIVPRSAPPISLPTAPPTAPPDSVVPLAKP